MEHATLVWKLGIYAFALLCFLVLDFSWLGPIAGKFYRAEMVGLMRENFNWIAAVSFYALFVAGLCFFVIFPAVTDRSSMVYALGCAALFWLVTYGTYDLTGLAVIRDWSLPLALVDMAWGAALSTLVTAATLGMLRLI